MWKHFRQIKYSMIKVTKILTIVLSYVWGEIIYTYISSKISLTHSYSFPTIKTYKPFTIVKTVLSMVLI